MGLIFEKVMQGLNVNSTFQIYNKRIDVKEMRILKRIDLTFKSKETYKQVSYPYMENLKTLKQILPVPEFLLNSFKKYKLQYESVESEKIDFHGKKTVIYLHGLGSVSEDNSILHAQLIENDCDLIRISYNIDYEKENIYYPKKAADMLPFLEEIEMKIVPAVKGELIQVLRKLKNEYHGLFENKEIIIIAHSLGGGIIINLVTDFKDIKFSKLINLDGSLLKPAIDTGLDISQLHLSQDRLFNIDWITEENFKEPLKAIGQDYCKRINKLINNSTNKSTWIQIKDATHFSFTDFPYILKPYKIFKKIGGSRASAERIRGYVNEFILKSEISKVDSKDNLIRNEN